MAQAIFLPISTSDIDIGKPLPYAVFDGDRKMVLRKGVFVESLEQLEQLAEKGLYRDGRGLEGSAAPRGEAGEAPGAGGVIERSVEKAGEKAVDKTADSARNAHAAERVVAFDEIKLGIGDVFQVQMQIEQSESRYYVKLIGYVKGKSVLITTPEADGNLCFVREGQSFVVRFFSGKNAYAFTANVIRTSTIPFPHLHLSYPAQVRGLVVRSGERVGARLICSVTMHDGVKTRTAAGVVNNISVGGAMLLAREPLGRKGDIVSVKFRILIREIESYLTLDATLCAITRGESGSPDGEFQHGIQFAGLSNEDAIALTAFVYQKMVADSAGES